ncbi:MAG: metal-dependent hydrolase [Flavobacteriales bacterium]|nr:metal-dependent hydrolase [Flavobacteriales bacterium]
MDSLSQLVLGAATAEAVIGKKVGNRAILWGAIGGTIPDLDVLCRPFVDDVTGMDWHRGFSHSFLFFILFAPVLGWLISKVYRRRWGSSRAWAWAMFLTFVTHALLDCFTTWGTQVFWPIDQRVAWHTVFVADPLYTVPLLLTVLAVLFIRRTKPARQMVNWIGISVSTAYLAVTVVNKSIANEAFEEAFSAQDVQVEYFESRPTPLNSILWQVTAKVEGGYVAGFYSLLDEKPPSEMELIYIKRDDELLEPFRASEKIERLIFLSQGYYDAQITENGLQFIDLRFGQPDELATNGEGFVFGFDVIEGEEGLEVTQSVESEPDMDKASEGVVELWTRLKGI